MPRTRTVSLIAIGALLGALLVPVAGVTAATAATLQPSGLATGFQLDGDKTGGTPPGTFDWNSFLTAPVPNGSYTFTPTGAYTTTQGLASTGILDATFAWDNGTLAAACSSTSQDATGSPGSQTPNTNPWAPGSANVNEKGDLCSTASAYEVVTDAQGVRHAILYNYWTRLVGNGDMSSLQLLEGPALGRCDDVLIEFDYASNTGTLNVSFRRWTPTANDACANPNGAGQWLVTGPAIDFDWGVGVRTEGPMPVGNQPQSTFGEFAVDLTTAGLFNPDSCTTFAVSTMLTRTGNDFTAQTQDYFSPTDPMTISNCGSLTVSKEVVPEGYQSDDRFDYLVNRAGGGIVLPDADATQIADDLGIGETDVWQNVLGGTDYRLTETVSAPWSQQSIVCTTTQPGTGQPIQFVLDSPTDTFTVFPSTATDCVITNATSTVTVTKQTLPDGSTTDFAFDIGGNPVTLSDGESVTFAFAPGTTVDIAETVPAGWMADPGIVCTANGGPVGTAAASVQVTTVSAADVACTFTNTQLSTIVVSKEAFGTPDDTEFVFTGDWTSGTPALGPDGEFSIDVATGDGENYTQTFTEVLPGTYTVSEEPGQHGTILGSLLCTIGGVDVSFDEPSATFDLAPGDTVSCYFVNVTPGQILVVKETDPFEYDQDFPFEFGPTGSEPTESFTLNPLPGQATWSSGTLVGGQYDITELIGDVPDWTLTDITCDVPGGGYTPDLEGGVVTVDLPEAGVAECIFTNTADPAQVTVTKTAGGVADDYPWSFDFQLIDDDTGEVRTLTVDAENPVGTLPDIVPGANYTLVEVPQPGWTGTLTCDPDVPDADPAADGWQFSVPPSFDLQCTADNQAAPTTLTVEKTVTGVTPGYEWSFPFTLDPAEGVTPGATQTITSTGAGTASATWEGLLPGETYTLTEEDVPGWVEGELVCDGIDDLDPTPSIVEFVASPGLSLTCSVTNTPEPIGIEILKTALGGDATFQYVLTPIDPVGVALVASVATEGGTGTASFSDLVAGTTYSLEELDFEGWIEGELECTVTHAAGSTEPIDVTGFTVEPGDQIACSIENRAVGRIVVVKNVEGADGEFDFAGTWLEPSAFTIATSGGTGSATFEDVTPGLYDLTESAPVGYDNTLLVCVDGDAAGTASTVEGLTGRIALDPGETVVCTFTNTEWGSIIVDKTTLPAGSPQEFEFEWAPGGTTFALADETEPYSTGLLPPGDYTVTETSELPRWELAGIECVGAEGAPVVEGTSVTFGLPLQATVYCTFENAFQAPLEIDKTVTTAPERQSDGSFRVGYTVTVTNPGGLADTYDLDDDLLYGNGVTVDEAAVTSRDGVAVNPGWNGLDDARVATAVEIGPGVTHTFDIVVTITVSPTITTDQADCTAGSATEGTGTLNRATVVFTDGDAQAEACAPVPSTLPPTGVTLTALWLALGLLGGGAIALLLRRRRAPAEARAD